MQLEARPREHDTSADAVVLRDVTCTYPAPAGGTPYTVVKDVNLTLRAGEFVAFVGPTGCGKSTLLNVAAGLMPVTNGSVTVFGEPLHGLNAHAGYMFQTDGLLPWLTARKNVTLGLELRGVGRAEASERADDWLARVGLRKHGHRYPHQLSGGMKKRVSLAQLMVLQPRIVLMDEPFSALDIQTRQRMENELLSLWSSARASILFVTHDIEEAISLADRVIVLAAGPETHPIGDFIIDIPRPRDVMEVVNTARFVEIRKTIWNALKAEVITMYERSNE